jgi:hypothetical protein
MQLNLSAIFLEPTPKVKQQFQKESDDFAGDVFDCMKTSHLLNYKHE